MDYKVFFSGPKAIAQTGDLIGWVIVDRDKKEPVKTGSWSSRSAKLYSSRGRAKAALSYGSHRGKNKNVEIIPVYIQ